MKVISFDVGETLIDSYYLDYVWNETIPQLYAKKENLDLKEAQTYVLGEYDRVGVDDIRWYLPEYWFNYLNLDEDPLEVFRSHKEKVTFYPEVPEVLNRLKRYDLIIASSIPTQILEIILEKLRHYFKKIFSSVSDLMQVKKTPDFYGFICNDLEIAPSRLVHVGDNWESDFVFPRKAGVQSFLLDRRREKPATYVLKDLTEVVEVLK